MFRRLRSLLSPTQRSSFLTADARPIGFVLAGDIVSNTGYAKASRGLAAMIGGRYPVFGLSLHEERNDRAEPFPGTLITVQDVPALAGTYRLFVVQHTTPDQFTVYPGATNVGVFAWETRSIPRHLQWPERMACADAIWVPTTFVADFTRSCGYTGAVYLTPWVHDFHQVEQARVVTVDPKAWMIDVMPDGNGQEEPTVRKVPVSQLRSRGDTLLLAVQSLAPRKGLPLLLNEWRRYLSLHPDTPCVLVLKLSFKHAHGISGSPLEYLLLLLRRYGVQSGERLRLAVIEARLSDDEINALVASSDLYLSATLGEGFGMPITEALMNRVPVLVARHTGIADLLPHEYPLQIAFDEASVGLRDNMDVYPPAALWAIPREGEISDKIATFVSMSAAERAEMTAAAIAHANDFCGVDAVRSKLNACLDSLTGEQA